MEQLSAQLKERTKTAHQALEKIMVSRLKGMRSLDDYAHVLKTFYGFFYALELQTTPIMDSVIPDHGERRKADALLNDLGELGHSPWEGLASVPHISSQAVAWGAMYVMEGSTLGGKIISHMVQQHLPDAVHALSFFNGYGEASAQKWADFKAQLDAFPTNQATADMVIEGANQTFLSFKNWMEASADAAT